MRILIAGGGTGGHIYPALSIAEELKRRDQKNEILFIGTIQGVARSTIEEAGFGVSPIETSGWERRLSRKTLRFFISLLKGIFQSRRCILSFKPDVIIGMGGYSSGPPLILASLLGYKAMIHEQNSIPGLTNKVLGRLVKKIALSFEDCDHYFPSEKIVVTGNPVRTEIGKIARKEALVHFGFEDERSTIIVFGGSRGAHTINLATVEAFERLNRIKDRIQMIHISGKDDYLWVKERMKRVEFPFYLAEFIFEMPLALGAADIVVGRAGAGTIAEITQCGLPSILIPYPYATDDHQKKNASLLEEKGAAIVIVDRELNGEILAERLIELISDPERLREMGKRARSLSHPEATLRIIDLIYELVEAKG